MKILINIDLLSEAYKNSNNKYFLEGDPLLEALIGIKDLQMMGHSLWLVGSISKEKADTHKQQEWIEQHFPSLRTRTILLNGQDVGILSGDILFDYCPSTLASFREVSVIMVPSCIGVLNQLELKAADFVVAKWPEFIELVTTLEKLRQKYNLGMSQSKTHLW